MKEDPLQTPVQFVPGVGPRRAELLARLGIRTVHDLLWYLPRDVLDLSRLRRPSELEPDLVQTVRGVVVDRDFRELRHGRSLTAVLLDCSGQFVRGTWFNQPWMFQKFRLGDVVLFSGKPKWNAGRWEFNNPLVQWLNEDETVEPMQVLPRYGLTEGLKMHELRAVIRKAVERFGQYVADPLPYEFRHEHKLPHLREAVYSVHCPSTLQEYEQARARLIFDDLFECQLGLALRRRAWKKDSRAPRLEVSPKVDQRIRRLFPFELTEGQNQAIQEIVQDLASGRAMHRLLQAEVGAGKTAVAVYVMLVAVAAGFQAVLMAPTEVLAVQHWQTIDSLLQHSRVRRVLLTGSLTAAQRRAVLEGIGSGEIQLVVGTHAVIQKDVRFKKLAVAVIDEQHKFGVLQRARFSEGEDAPHVLVMTATPIPRSLCLTQFGDLDITRITELPPGRQPVVTTHVRTDREKRRAWDFIRQRLKEGRQLYVVCPRIEASGSRASLGRTLFSERNNDEPGREQAAEGPSSSESDGSLPGDVARVFRRLSEVELRGFTIDVLHGQMDTQQRELVMKKFRAGETQVLISTTVIEVGVDVPNATLMAVLEAERFGLSQLHQLRGRVARGKFQGYCFLFSDATNEDALKRLQALETVSDGFRIAEIDFELRGPGDVLGTRQHGQLPLRVADLIRDHAVLVRARKLAFELVESGRLDRPEFAPLKIQVLERFGQLMDLPKTG